MRMILEDGNPSSPVLEFAPGRLERRCRCLTAHNRSCSWCQRVCAMRCFRRTVGELAMRSDSPLSDEIRYVFSVHGGILMAGVAMLLRNVALMAKLSLGSDRPWDHGSAGMSRRRFPARVTEPQRECPACFP